jgi:HK97 family phage major capsid protein
MGVKEDLIEARGKLAEGQKRMKDIFDQAGPDRDMKKVTLLEGDTVQKARAIAELNNEIAGYAEHVDIYAATVRADEDQKRREAGIEEDKNDPGFKHRNFDGDPDDKSEGKTIGQLFAESDAYQKKGSNAIGPVSALPVNVKTLMTTTAGWAPQTTRTGRVVELATRPIQVIDLIPSGRTDQQAVVYMEETTFTNSAAETAEAGTYPESALALTQRSSPVQKVATFLPVTDEQLEDVAGIQSYVDSRLQFMLRQRLDGQIIVGNGTPPNLKGILNVSGIQTQALGIDPQPDAVYKAMTLVRVTGRAIPNGMLIHPTDWQSVKLLRTADGVYIWGNPSDMTPDRIWGLNVALTDAITLHTAVIGDFANFSQLVMRRDVEVQVSNSHSTFFIEGKQAIRADMRCALVFYRPAAFCTITGLV